MRRASWVPMRGRMMPRPSRATKSLLSELDSLSRACMDVTRQERDAIDEGDQNTEGPGDDL
jgi:hypothetical protein